MSNPQYCYTIVSACGTLLRIVVSFKALVVALFLWIFQGQVNCTTGATRAVNGVMVWRTDEVGTSHTEYAILLSQLP